MAAAVVPRPAGCLCTKKWFWRKPYFLEIDNNKKERQLKKKKGIS
jgi:hypothetical protein